MDKSHNHIISLLLFSIVFITCPIITLPVVIKGMLKKKRWAFVMFAIIMGLVGYLWPPYGDMYRYALDLYNMKGMDWQTFQLFMLLRFDIFLPYLSYWMANVGGSFDIIKFIFNAIGYLLIADVLRMVVQYNHIYASKKYYICAFLVIIPFSLNGYLFRSGLGVVILLNGLIRWFYFKQKKGILICILSALVHVSNVLFAFFLLLPKLNIFRFRPKVVLMIFVLSLFMGFGGIAEFIINLIPIPDNMISHIYQYIDGSQSGSVTKGFSFLQLIVQMSRNILDYIWFYLYWKLYKKYSGKLPMMEYVNITLLFLLLISSFPWIYTRYFGATMNIVKIIVLLNLSVYLLNLVRFKLICYITMLFVCIGIYENRFCLTIGNEPKLLSSSLYGILNTEYTESWIVDNLNKKGDFYERIRQYGEPE